MGSLSNPFVPRLSHPLIHLRDYGASAFSMLCFTLSIHENDTAGAFSHNKFPLNLGKEEVQQVKIELDNSDEQNPMKIKKVFVKSPGCDFVEIKIGLDSFKKKAYYPSAINMMNKFSEAHIF